MDTAAASHRTLQVGRTRVHVVTQGHEGSDIVLLHGVPTNTGLWRHVQPALASESRATAIDLPGFGRSEPIERQGDIGALTDVLEATLDALGIHKPIFVALDLGLLLALQWAARHPDRVPGIVMMEGFFLPMKVGWKALPMSSRLMMRLARWPWLAERAIVGDNTAVARFLRSGVLRQLSADEIARYADPWRDPTQRRQVWLHGINAGVLVPPSRGKGDAVDLIDRAARALERSATPKLLLTASPGMVVTPATVDRARERLSNLKVVNIGAGKHFLPEDQPAAIAHEVGAFVRTLAPRRLSCEPPPENPATYRSVAGHP